MLIYLIRMRKLLRVNEIAKKKSNFDLPKRKDFSIFLQNITKTQRLIQKKFF
jgi:hypothetical protein